MATGDMTSVLPTEWREGMMLLSARFLLLPAETSVSFREICIQRSSADRREIAPPGNIMMQDTADIRDRHQAEMPSADIRDRLQAEMPSADIRDRHPAEMSSADTRDRPPAESALRNIRDGDIPIRAMADIRDPDMMSIPEMFRPARVPFLRDLSAATRVISP